MSQEVEKNSNDKVEVVNSTEQLKPTAHKMEINWAGFLLQFYLCYSFLYGITSICQIQLYTFIFFVFLTSLSILSITAGAHRLWAHGSYVANTPLKIFLMIFHTVGGTGTIYGWVRDHRLHHKYVGTDNDPYNHKRGFFYAHVGNKILAKNPSYEELLKEIDVSDLEKDSVIMFQKRYYWILYLILCLLLPINAPVEYWDEGMLNSVAFLAFVRLPITFHLGMFINSAMCIWALKPNDRFFSDSNLVYILKKSYWHEYHYTIPWDCLVEEFGSYDKGCTTVFIKIWSAMGLVTEIKTFNSQGMMEALKLTVRTGKTISESVDAILERDDFLSFRETPLKIMRSRPKGL